MISLSFGHPFIIIASYNPSKTWPSDKPIVFISIINWRGFKFVHCHEERSNLIVLCHYTKTKFSSHIIYCQRMLLLLPIKLSHNPKLIALLSLVTPLFTPKVFFSSALHKIARFRYVGKQFLHISNTMEYTHISVTKVNVISQFIDHCTTKYLLLP